MNTPLLGIEIGGTKLQLVLGDAQGGVRERWKGAVALERGAAGIREVIEEQVRAWRRDFRFDGVGAGFGGPVNWRTGRIARSHQVEGWSSFDLVHWLSDLAAAPARVDNDANVAALAEALCGAGKNSPGIFYVTLGSGVGGGMVVNGRIYHGATPGECEIGHLRLDMSGTTVESKCSGWAVDKRIAELPALECSGPLWKLSSGMMRGQAAMLGPALAQSDPAARRILTQTAETLAFALSHVTHLLHPEVVVLGGGLSRLGEPLRAAVAEALPRFLMGVFQPGSEIRLSALGEDAVPVGALLLAAGAR